MDVATQASLEAGIYTTDITFYNNSDEVVFTTDKLRLQVFSEGTLDLEGELLSFTSDKAEYQEGEVVVLTGTFKNTGSVGLKTALAVEILLDDLRTEVLKTEQVFLPIGQTVELETTFRARESGTYTANGYATYGPNQTETYTVNFVVKSVNYVVVVIVLGAITALLAAGLWWFYHSKKKARNGPKKPRKKTRTKKRK